MQLTPKQAHDHIKESAIQYLETAYKIAHSDVFAERGKILRQSGTVAQDPFIEATPAFPKSRKLIELEESFPKNIPKGLSDLVSHGVPVDRFLLYTHQEEALLASFSSKPNLLVSTGTGSGKTETFLLPILADLMHEAAKWHAPAKTPSRGKYDAKNNVWLHSRRHETRSCGLRAIILYPMNALVNDQLSRLRRILALNTSPDWQQKNFNGNVINFGMYTSLAQPTGFWENKTKVKNFYEYMKQIDEDWANLKKDLRDTGFWSRPDSPEMVCRWDMQMSPPDILITNYSMLEYMLVRPIEAPIFEKTRLWLEKTPESRLTLVLDEAHTYTGARGTEVAHLIRRLKERLGIESGSTKFRSIATSASIPTGAEKRSQEFIAELFDEPIGRFSMIQLGEMPKTVKQRRPTLPALRAFAKFYDNFNNINPFAAIENLANDLNLGPINRTVSPQIALHSLLKENEEVNWVLERTARNATILTQLSEECWGTIGTHAEKERATAGILAAGSYARPSDLPEIPPLLSMRVHAFFRGIPGIWACMNPNCPEVGTSYRQAKTDRPVGRLYLEPRLWCSPKCGSRVLELFSCRQCGLLFLGGIPDQDKESLWPWSDEMTGERQDLKSYSIFGVGQPHSDVNIQYRSLKTTLPVTSKDRESREVYETEPAMDKDGQLLSPFPKRCPRCQNYRAPGVDGREVIEPLRTRGPRTFSIIAEDGFRVQPSSVKGKPPNYGRKSLLFTDSRNEAAQLAADLRRDHNNDLFRQVIYRLLYTCANCEGTGQYEERGKFIIGEEPKKQLRSCDLCNGKGYIKDPKPIGFLDLRRRIIEIQLNLGIDPTYGKLENFMTEYMNNHTNAITQAEIAFNATLRRELSEDDFGLEPLGLAKWRVNLPEQIGHFEELTEEETRQFLQCVTRVLCTENILLPPQPLKPWEWSQDFVKPYERNRLFWGYQRVGEDGIPYNLTKQRKLGRFVIAISKALVAEGRIPDMSAAGEWVKNLQKQLWQALKEFQILQWAGQKIGDQVPYGIRIDSFDLHSIEKTVHRCTACAYIMSGTLFDVCLRCGQKTEIISTQDIKNFYRRGALFALPQEIFNDPYPLRSIEHTAQISGSEARNIERWFQDLFHEDQNEKDFRIDVLSVTTTMEMGIDIGSLLNVGLRNVPPNVANYQQRAGRAGRRGSALATVLTFSQFRSHDQYYFHNPPKIVSDPPSVPTLYIQNEIITQRHIRSMILQSFFYHTISNRQTKGLFGSWGTVGDFINKQWTDKLQQYLSTNRAPLLERCTRIVHADFRNHIDGWLDVLPQEVQDAILKRDDKEDMLEILISEGLLPKYAFPVDVVSLNIPSYTYQFWNDDRFEKDGMQRDLKIALSEYAPGAEIIKGEFPKTYLYKVAGIHDSFDKSPYYKATGRLVECTSCKSIRLFAINKSPSDQCQECGGFDVGIYEYMRPPGFTVDGALPGAGRVEYEGGGRERAGYTPPAHLLIGQTSFNAGQPQVQYAPNLYTLVRTGELFMANKGPHRDFPGFLICPVCGRAFFDEPGKHQYPAHIPPHQGKNKGPRQGDKCPNQNDFKQMVLGYPFHSEVILLGVDLLPNLDAPITQPAGRAIWYSFGTLIATSAALLLQIDPTELRVGVRAIKRNQHSLHGEVYIYDDVPGGAGYARSIGQNLKEILELALKLGETCENPDCSGACYHCLYDYRNQMLHPFLDRELGTALLKFILKQQMPTLDPLRVKIGTDALGEYARGGRWNIAPGFQAGSIQISQVLEDKMVSAQKIGVWVIHPLQKRPTSSERQAIQAQHGIRCAVHTLFDLERRPFWVINNLMGT